MCFLAPNVLATVLLETVEDIEDITVGVLKPLCGLWINNFNPIVTSID
jgi:hypothetical protein